MNLYSKLFECKFKDELPRYDGRKEGVSWRKKVRNFLTSRCPDMAEALNKAERSTSIPHGSLDNEFTAGGASVAVLDALLWGFLNTNLTDDAWNILDVVSGAEGHTRGLEVWRRLCDDIVNKSSAERLLMEDHILRPAPCKGIEDVMSRIDSWDVERQAWVRSGGRILDEYELVSIIITMLPPSLKQKAIFDMPDALHRNSEEFKRWLREKIKLMHTWKIGTLQSTVHVIEE